MQKTNLLEIQRCLFCNFLGQRNALQQTMTALLCQAHHCFKEYNLLILLSKHHYQALLEIPDFVPYIVVYSSCPRLMLHMSKTIVSAVG